MTEKRWIESVQPVFVFPERPEDMTPEQVSELLALLNVDALKRALRAALGAEIEREGHTEGVA